MYVCMYVDGDSVSQDGTKRIPTQNFSDTSHLRTAAGRLFVCMYIHTLIHTHTVHT